MSFEPVQFLSSNLYGVIFHGANRFGFVVAECSSEPEARQMADAFNQGRTYSIPQRIREPRIETPFNFEEAYELYPRKQGRSNGYKHLARDIKTEKDLVDLLIAVRHYAKYVERERIQRKYTKCFDTFCRSWRDWLPENAASPASQSQPQETTLTDFRL